ncbi:MAG: energy-coupling factor transporter transmembrane component T [Candidatus Dormibacteria bacterium]
MTPRSWIVWSASGLVVVLSSTDPAYRVLVALVAANVLLAWRRPHAPLRGLFAMVALATVAATITNALLSHTGTHVIVDLPAAIPGLGGPVTVESLLYGADVGLGIAAAILVVAPLGRVLEAHDLLDAVPGPLQRSAALVGSAVNLVPGLARTAVAVAESQKLRGGHRSRVWEWRGVVAPVVLSALDDSLQHAEAMEARGFGAGRRTRYATARLGGAGILTLAGALAAAAATVVARAGGALPDWYPFPTATYPPVAPLGLCACALLAIPLLPWKRS